MGQLSGMALAKGVCELMEVKPRLIVLVTCPYCGAPGRMEMEPAARTFWCGNCNKSGRLEELHTVAEGVFLHRHRATKRLMEQRPGPGWEREGGGRR